MDRHEFEYKGEKFTARDGTLWITGRVPRDGELLRAACAEILRLAGDRGKFKRWAKEECGKAARAQHNADEANQRLSEAEQELDAMQAALFGRVDQNAELSMALAVLAGESLKPCGDAEADDRRPCDGECDACGKQCGDMPPCRCHGHLGPKAAEACQSALVAWRALQDGNRAAVERIAGLEKQVRGLEAAIVIARSRVEHAERRAEGAEQGAQAVLEADAAIQSEHETDARLGRELCAILQEHRQENDLDGERVPAETAGMTLRRLIKELHDTRSARRFYDSAYQREREERGAIEKELRAFRVREETEHSLENHLLRQLLTEIQAHHGEHEGALDTLRRIIREREEAVGKSGRLAQCADAAIGRETHYLAVAQRLQAEKEAVERENRAKCLELAEKAGEIQWAVAKLAEKAEEGRELQRLVRWADSLLCRCRNIYEHEIFGAHHFPSDEIGAFLRDARKDLKKQEDEQKVSEEGG